MDNWITKQEHFSGVGKHLRSKILYHSRIDPTRTIETLTNEERKLLYEMTIKIIKDSYRANGLMINSYKSPNGRKGSYICTVYQRKTDHNGIKCVISKLGQVRSFSTCKKFKNKLIIIQIFAQFLDII